MTIKTNFFQNGKVEGKGWADRKFRSTESMPAFDDIDDVDDATEVVEEEDGDDWRQYAVSSSEDYAPPTWLETDDSIILYLDREQGRVFFTRHPELVTGEVLKRAKSIDEVLEFNDATDLELGWGSLPLFTDGVLEELLNWSLWQEGDCSYILPIYQPPSREAKWLSNATTIGAAEYAASLLGLV
ncbi:MAG: hypothetical protein HC892_00335 [Saprospiraceae bacterium]|nr:hypothetical protein [Saprospiraceae bacterium]